MARNYPSQGEIYSGQITSGIYVTDGTAKIPITLSQGWFNRVGNAVTVSLYFIMPDLSSMTQTDNLYIGGVPVFDKTIIGDTVGACRLQRVSKISENTIGYNVRTSGDGLVITEIIENSVSPYVNAGQYNQGSSSTVELSITYLIG